MIGKTGCTTGLFFIAAKAIPQLATREDARTGVEASGTVVTAEPAGAWSFRVHALH